MRNLIRRAPAAAAAAVALAICAATAVGELPPEVYRERQQASPEALVIKVKSVKSSETRRPGHTLVANTVEAVVENVARTATRPTCTRRRRC